MFFKVAKDYRKSYYVWFATILLFILLAISASIMSPKDVRDNFAPIFYLDVAGAVLTFFIWVYLIFFQKNAVMNRNYIHLTAFIGLIIYSISISVVTSRAIQ